MIPKSEMDRQGNMVKACGAKQAKLRCAQQVICDHHGNHSSSWQVPFTLQDEDIPDDWHCAQNVWDNAHNSCSIPQALTDEEIDEILSLQASN